MKRNIGIKRAVEISLTVLALVGILAVGAYGQRVTRAIPGLEWAYPVATPQPPEMPAQGPKTLPGSKLSLTPQQINDAYNPPDWYPDEHAPLPNIVAHGSQVMACALCHLTSGMGHPESADIAGLPLEYMRRQIADFKAHLRNDAEGYTKAARASRMQVISEGAPREQIDAALQYFSELEPEDWYDVIEADMVPKTWVTGGLMRLPLPGSGMEPIGNRIITLPKDPERVEMRDPHSGFIAYVPKGSLARGKALVTTGGGKTTQCAVCHGEDLRGLGDIPRIAGVHPIYLMRQFYNFQSGANTSSMGAQMRNVVKDLSRDDMIAIAAYVASLEPK